MYPRRELRISPELRKLFPHPHEHILCQLFTSRSRSAHPGAQREHTIHMRPVQPLERPSVASGREHHIGRVVRRCCRAGQHRPLSATFVTCCTDSQIVSEALRFEPYFRRIVSGPLVVVALMVAPPEPSVVEMSRVMRPTTVIGNPRLTGPFVVPASSLAL